AREPGAEPRNHLMNMKARQRCHDTAPGLAKLQDANAAAWSGDPLHFPERLRTVSAVANAKGNGHGIEAIVLELQILADALVHADSFAKIFSVDLAAADLEHLGRGIDAYDA